MHFTVLPASARIALLTQLLTTAPEHPPLSIPSSNLPTLTFHRENVHLTSLIGYIFLKLAATMFKKTLSVYLEFKGMGRAGGKSWQEEAAEDWQLVAPSCAVSQSSHAEWVMRVTCFTVPCFHRSPPISIYGHLCMV